MALIVADRGREFAFCVLPDWMNKDSSVWRYRLEPVDDGTRVVESQEIAAWPVFPVTFLTRLASRDDDMQESIRQSLERIKAIVESGVPAAV